MLPWNDQPTPIPGLEAPQTVPAQGVVVSTPGDHHHFFAVFEAAGEAIERARDGGGPTLIEVKFTRYFGHFEGDQQSYRADEVAYARETLDCLKSFRGRVIGIIPNEGG